MRHAATLLGLALLLGSWSARAAEPTPGETRIDLDATVVSGNEELPKVLYIVPWQAPDGRVALPPQDVTVDDGLFSRLKPAAHRRETLFLNNLTGSDPKE